MSLRISCLQKKGDSNAHERIKKVGGTNPDGTRWWLTADEAIAGIESHRYDFYVQVDGRRVDVVLAERNGRWYLKTENDGDSPDNLLALPECP